MTTMATTTTRLHMHTSPHKTNVQIGIKKPNLINYLNTTRDNQEKVLQGVLAL